MYALLDWDGTLRRGATMDSWCAFLLNKKQISDKYFIEREYLKKRFADGLISHDEMAKQTNNSYIRAVKGMDESTFSHLADEFVMQDEGPNILFTQFLMEWLRKNDIKGFVISGSPINIIGKYFNKMGIIGGIAFQEEIADGKLTGKQACDGGHDKRKAIDIFCNRYKSIPVLAVGDSESDIPMFDTAKYRIVVGQNEYLKNKYSNAVCVNHNMTACQLENVLNQIKIAKEGNCGE